MTQIKMFNEQEEEKRPCDCWLNVGKCFCQYPVVKEKKKCKD